MNTYLERKFKLSSYNIHTLNTCIDLSKSYVQHKYFANLFTKKAS